MDQHGVTHECLEQAGRDGPRDPLGPRGQEGDTVAAPLVFPGGSSPPWPSVVLTPETPSEELRKLHQMLQLERCGKGHNSHLSAPLPEAQSPPLPPSVAVPWAGMTSPQLSLQLIPASHFEP